MFFEQLEKDIQARLKAKIGNGIDVDILPETESGYRKPFEKARVTVCYTSSDFDKPKSTSEISQDEEQTIEVVIQARALRGVMGIYDVANRISKALIGFRTAHSRKMYATSFKYSSKEENLWAYTYTFAIKTTVVEQPDDVSEPLITQITQESIYETSVTPDPEP